MTLLHQVNEPSPPSVSPPRSNAPPVTGFVMQLHGGVHDGRIIRVVDQKCTIGRALNCTVRLASSRFEPLHAILVRGQGGVVVRCCGQGTTLNGQKFSVSWMVPGDRLELGGIEFELLDQATLDGQPTAEPKADLPAPQVAVQQDVARGISRQLNKRRVRNLSAQLRKLRIKTEEIASELRVAGQHRDEAMSQLVEIQRRYTHDKQRWDLIRESLLDERRQAEQEMLKQFQNENDELCGLAISRTACPPQTTADDGRSASAPLDDIPPNDDLIGVTDQLARAEEFVAQLLEERQELLERLGILQHDIESLQAAARAAEVKSLQSAAWETELRQLQSELHSAVSERDLMRAIVTELREEVEGLVGLREKWYDEREALQGQLEEARRCHDTPVHFGDQNAGQIDGLRPCPTGQDDESDAPAALSLGLLNDADTRGEVQQLAGNLLDTREDDPAAASVDEATFESTDSPVCWNSGSDSDPHGSTRESCDECCGVQDLRATQHESETGERRAATVAIASEQDDDEPYLDEVKKRPRSAPQINLSAMRDVANQTARVAINQAAHRRGLQEAASKWLMGICAIMMGGIVTVIFKDNEALARVAVGLCWVIAVWWMCVGVLRYRRAVMVDPKRQERKVRRAALAKSGDELNEPSTVAQDGPNDVAE